MIKYGDVPVRYVNVYPAGDAWGLPRDTQGLSKNAAPLRTAAPQHQRVLVGNDETNKNVTKHPEYQIAPEKKNIGFYLKYSGLYS